MNKKQENKLQMSDVFTITLNLEMLFYDYEVIYEVSVGSPINQDIHRSLASSIIYCNDMYTMLNILHVEDS